MVKVLMTDFEMNELLHWLSSEASNVNTLVITNNELTVESLKALTNFVEREVINGKSELKFVYIGNNYIRVSEGYKYQKLLKEKEIELVL